MSNNKGIRVGGGHIKNYHTSDKIQCTVDMRYERPEQFSNNERKKYLANKRYKIRCRKHSQAPAAELTCSSCDEKKPLEDFSNNERKNKDDLRRCRECVNHTETVQLFAEMDMNTDNAPQDDYDLDIPSMQAGVDDGDSVSMDDASTQGYSSTYDAALTANILNSHDKFTPPHPREGDRSYNASSAPSDSFSATSTKTYTTQQHRQPRLYTAYGPDGQVQQRGRAADKASETASVATTTTANTPVAVKRTGWAKIDGRKLAVEAPDRTLRGKVDKDSAPKRFAYDSDDSEDEC